MKRPVSRKGRWFGYAFFSVVAALCFLYYLFPADAVRDYLQMRAENSNPSLVLSIDRIRPWLPLGLRSGKTENLAQR